MHNERAQSSPDLPRRITAVMAEAPVDMLCGVWCEVEFGFDDCRAVSGAHIKFR